MKRFIKALVFIEEMLLGFGSFGEKFVFFEGLSAILYLERKPVSENELC